MSNLAWLGIPVLAVVIATVWAHWSSRPRGPKDPMESVAAYERFRSAIEHGDRRGAGRRR